MANDVREQVCNDDVFSDQDGRDEKLPTIFEHNNLTNTNGHKVNES